MDAKHYKSLVKKYFLWTGCICTFALTMFLLVFYTLDPLQFFHRSSVEDGPLSSNMRAQAAGILNTFDFDSIILGTSMLENSSAAEASAKLGGKFFNISISGGTEKERSVILKRALQKNLKAVLYSVDRYYTDCAQRDERLPHFLYDDNPLNDFKYYANLANIKKLFQDNRGLTQENHDHPNAWFNLPEEKNRFGGIENWTAHKDNPQLTHFLFHGLPFSAKVFGTATRDEVHDYEKEQQAKRYIDEHVLEIIKDHKDTNFYLIFPPYLRFIYAYMRRVTPKDFFLHQEIIRYLVDKTKESKNIQIYGFEDQDFPDEIANYKDPYHYHQKFNSMFLDDIAAGRHELTPENVESYLKKCEQKAWDFDIPALHAKVQELLGASATKARQ